MGYIRGVDRGQRVLFPEALDEYVGTDNPVRFLDAFVQGLDLNALGFARAKPARTGAPGYDPRLMLCLYIYGYLHRIRSSRRLETETKRNVEVMWLTGRLSPDFKTIADFRKVHVDQITGVCREFTHLCKRLDLFGKELVGIDGSKFRAVNADTRNYTARQLAGSLKKIDEQIAAYLQALDEGDEEEARLAPVSAGELKKKIEALREKGAEGLDEVLGDGELDEKIKGLLKKNGSVGQLLKKMQEEGQTQVSLTDPDSRLMKTQGRMDVCYNAQFAVDSKHHLIVAHDITNAENDQEQLAGMAIAAKEMLEVDTLVVVADGGYHTEAQAAQCETAGIEVHMPRPQGRGALFQKTEFTYLPEEDAYRCPADALLTYRHTEKKEGKTYRCYQTSACAGCPLRERCTKDGDGRRIRRSDLEWAVELIEARVQANPEILKQRKSLAEHAQGTMKHWKGEGTFLLRGLRKVRGEFSLSVLTYNLRRVLNLLPMSVLMAALEADQASTVSKSVSERGCAGVSGGLCVA
jgi:transposase